MRLKKLDMSNEIDKHILLTYFFKKLDTKIDKKELLGMSSIYFDSQKNKLCAHTKRFQEKLEPYKEIDLHIENVDDTLKKILQDEFRIQEELVRCELSTNGIIEYFYITVIGVDFFLIEKDFLK